MIPFILIAVVGLALFVVSIYLSVSQRYFDKLSVYECGFDPYADARLKFDIVYYLIALLFLLFDLELVFLFPFTFLLCQLTMISFWTYMIFFLLLTIGFIYELESGSLKL